jgi:carbamoyl-phosphate synthase large subunit
MRATGEVMGIASSFGRAFYKAQISAGSKLPLSGTVLITVAPKTKEAILPVAKKLEELGFDLVATTGTSAFLTKNKVKNTLIHKIDEGRPNIADAIKNGELSLIINTPIGKDSKEDDSFIRMMAIQRKIPYVTSVAAAEATVEGIAVVKQGDLSPCSLQELYTEHYAGEKLSR